MIKKIKNLDDVAEFMVQLTAEGLNYHPDDDFKNYINADTGEGSYSDSEAALRNRLNEEAFYVCEINGADIYDISMEIYLKATGLDQYIPLPSQNPS